MRVLGYLAAGVAALLAAFLLWEAAFALAVAMHSHSWTLWQRFAHGHELLLPLQSATAEWDNPAVKKIVGRASLGATLAFVIVSAGAAQIFNNFRSHSSAKGRGAFGDRQRPEGGGFAEWPARLFDLSRALQRRRRALQRAEPHLCERPDALGQGHRLRSRRTRSNGAAL